MKPNLSYSRCRLTSLVIALPVMTAGCVPVTNALLGGPPLSALSGTSTEESPSRSWTTSLNDGFDRSAWTRSEIRVPIAEVQHNPTYVGDPIGGDQKVGRKGEDGAFPTIATATSVDVDEEFVIKSALIAPFIAIADLVISPIRMCIAPPWSIQASPDDDWQLLPIDPKEPCPAAEAAPVTETTASNSGTTATTGSEGEQATETHAFERPADAADAADASDAPDAPDAADTTGVQR
jgi:hypothetical protein